MVDTECVASVGTFREDDDFLPDELRIGSGSDTTLIIFGFEQNL